MIHFFKSKILDGLSLIATLTENFNIRQIIRSTHGLSIIDVSTPSNPTYVGGYDTPIYTYQVEVSGNYAYVSDDSNGVVVLDISNPSSPSLYTTYSTKVSSFWLTISGDYLYVADTENGLEIINIAR